MLYGEDSDIHHAQNLVLHNGANVWVRSYKLCPLAAPKRFLRLRITRGPLILPDRAKPQWRLHTFKVFGGTGTCEDVPEHVVHFVPSSGFSSSEADGKAGTSKVLVNFGEGTAWSPRHTVPGEYIGGMINKDSMRPEAIILKSKGNSGPPAVVVEESRDGNSWEVVTILTGLNNHRRNPQMCFNLHRAVNCAVSEWSSYTLCTRSCGTGSQRRSRVVIEHPRNGGTKCPRLEEGRSCNTLVCKTDCALSEWSEWSDCRGGLAFRKRLISIPERQGGKECPPLREFRRCKDEAMPLRGANGCEMDFSQSCPSGWSIAVGMGSEKGEMCEAPPAWGSVCSKGQAVNGRVHAVGNDEDMRMAWAQECNVTWPCKSLV